MPTQRHATYEFLIRDLHTLEVLGELRPQDVTMKWTRRDLEGGTFHLVIPIAAVTPALAALANIVEVRRDLHDGEGARSEFTGVIEARQLDPFARTWTLEGGDLLWFWLSKRVVGPDNPVALSGVAETVLKEFVEDNLGSGADAGRQAASEISVDWTIEADAASGESIDVRYLRANLLTEVAVPVCRMGDLLQTVELLPDYTGYVYRVKVPRDRTVGSGSLPFSVGWDNAERLVYRDDLRSLVNSLAVLGPGSGDSREITTIDDSSSITNVLRREGTFDGRYAESSDERTSLGTMEVRRQILASQTAEVKPYRLSENARYREDWDVGDHVTVAIAEIGESFDTRIDSVTVSLERGTSEEISFVLGGIAYDTYAPIRINERLRALNAAANE